MEKNFSSLDASSNMLPMYKQELQPSTSTSQSNNSNQKDREYISCHICAIEVPRRFINEHYESDKHKINTKIADVALQRVHKSLLNSVVGVIDKTESLYFCPQCVISLNSKDRQSHEKTVVHKKAVTVDKFLYDFYVLYANQDENHDLERECEATVVLISNNVEQSNEIDNISPTIEKSQLMNASEQIEIKTNDSVRNNNENAIINPLKNDAINNSNVIEVNKKTNNPFKSKVNNTSHFDISQFCTFGSNKSHIFCKMCKVYIPNNSGNITSQQTGFKHKEVLRKVMTGNGH